MVRSLASVFAGIILLTGGVSVAYSLILIAPALFYHCSVIPGPGGTECSATLDPALWIILPSFIAGAGLVAFGILGRKFVLAPLFLAGMVPLTWGSMGIIMGYLSRIWCTSAPFFLSCIAENFGTFYVALIGGLFLISIQASVSLRSHLGLKRTPPPVRVLQTVASVLRFLTAVRNVRGVGFEPTNP